MTGIVVILAIIAVPLVATLLGLVGLLRKPQEPQEAAAPDVKPPAARDRSASARKAWETRKRRQAMRDAPADNPELDHLLAEIHKSENDIHHKVTL